MFESCVFCKIALGKIPCFKIFETNKILAFLDISPASRGHALVIPKKHFETLSEIPENELRELIVAVKNVANAIVDSAEAEGFNILQSNGKAAGQIIPHVHFHIIPRKQNDELSFEWEKIEHDKEELESFSKAVKSKLFEKK